MGQEFSHSPRIVRNLYGLPVEERTTIKLPALDSAAIYLGSFVPFITGTDAAPAGAEFGIPAFTDDSRVFGFVSGFTKGDSNVPIWELGSSDYQGTVTAATGELPLKYTFSSTNDESNTTSADLEQVVITPIHAGDILEVSLWGASTVAVARGTTTTAGTTTSSANIGVSMSVDTTYSFALLESSAAKNTANLDFITTEIDGQKPTNSKRVYAQCIRAFSAFENAD